MAVNLSAKRATETGRIALVNGDGSPMVDDEGNEATATVYGPGSKRWQQADAERSRKRTQRIEKNRGKISAALEGGADDEVEFLVAITISFDGISLPNPDSEDGEWPSKSDMARAIYTDSSLGFIRDHIHKEAHEWGNFTKG